MQRACTKCRKVIATTIIECECRNVFHPKCVKLYSASMSAAQCCKALTSSLPPTPGVESVVPRKSSAASSAVPPRPGVESASSAAPPTPGVECTEMSFDFANMTAPASTQLQSRIDDTTNELLRQLIEQMRVSDARFSAFVEDQRRTNSGLNVFVEDQRRTNSELNDKLNRLNCIAENVDRNSQRIAELERQCAALTSEVRDLRGDWSDSHSVPRTQSCENMLIISGIPAAMSITPLACVRNVFSTLDVPELSCHILDIRPVVRKPQPVAARDRTLPVSSTNSYIVTLASGAVRDTVISKKRARRTLKQKDVCDNGSDRNVHVNEFLPKEKYDLLQRAKRVVREKSYRYIWVKEGRIRVRHSDGEPVIQVNSEADLEKLV